jgi:cyclin-dependent kinase 8/11
MVLHGKYEFNPDGPCLGEGSYGKVFRGTVTAEAASEAAAVAAVAAAAVAAAGSVPAAGAALVAAQDTTVAIKQFKAHREDDGIPQNTIRELFLLWEFSSVPSQPCRNIMRLLDVLIDGGTIYAVFEFAEIDLSDLLFHHSSCKAAVPEATAKVVTYQLLNGLAHLHENGVLHRDIKPDNVLLTQRGVVKIGDFGLARIYREALDTMLRNNLVVVTLWYRAPELLLGTHHYGCAIDVWAVGCILAELLTLRVLFQSQEREPIDLFQADQVAAVFKVLGPPTAEDWPLARDMPNWHLAAVLEANAMAEADARGIRPGASVRDRLYRALFDPPRPPPPPGKPPPPAPPPSQTPLMDSRRELVFDLLCGLLAYDPSQRLTARQALSHAWFHDVDTESVFLWQFNYGRRPRAST